MNRSFIFSFKSFFFFIICSNSLFSQTQKETNFWFFGNYAGIDFNSGVPVSVVGGRTMLNEGTSVMSDKTTGALLFYTQGDTVWDRTHAKMPNGVGLWGSSSTTQTSVIIPKPGSNDSIYYIFTADGSTSGYPNGGKFAYSVVNMNRNVGKGDVMTKNVFLYDTTSEKIAAIKHANGCSYWVVSHKINSDAFYSYLVTNRGVKGPVISHTGFVYQVFGDAGELKFSPNGKKIASTTNSVDTQIFDFDNNTGIISNPLTLPGTACYGLSFSPDNSKLYLSTAQILYQYDFSSGVPATIIASQFMLGPFGNLQYAIQMGPDQKLYVVQGTGCLVVVGNPNVAGVGCNAISNSFCFTGTGVSGLPNFIQSYFDTASLHILPIVAAAAFTGDTCEGDTIQFTNMSIGATPFDSVLWNFDDPTSGGLNMSSSYNTSHAFSSSGIHHVKLFMSNGCYLDSTTISVNILPKPSVSASSNIQLCTGDSTTLTASGGVSYLWSNGSTFSSITIHPTSFNTYNVRGTGVNGCRDTVQIHITVNQVPILSVSNDTTICEGEDVTLIASGGTNYVWNIGQSVSGINVSPTNPTSYTVIVLNPPCADTAIVNVNVLPPPVVVAKNDTTIFAGKSVILSGTGVGSYLWNPATSLSCTTCANPVVSPTVTTTYYLVVTDAGGCTGIDSVVITVEIECEDVFIPNAFSPNNDIANDQLCVYGGGDCIKNFNFIIYNRWGEKVFETENKKKCWDGMYNGHLQNTGIFVYYFEAVTLDNRIIKMRSNISLIR